MTTKYKQSDIMADELPDERIKNGFMSEEYFIEFLASLEMNVEPDDILHIVDKTLSKSEELGTF